MTELVSPSSSASSAAAKSSEIWTKALTFRISLQKPLDLANMLPVARSIQDHDNLIDSKLELVSILSDLISMLSQEKEIDRKDIAKGDLQKFWWPKIVREIASKRVKWETVVNQWQARLRVHSTTLKTFNETIWSQVPLHPPHLTPPTSL